MKKTLLIPLCFVLISIPSIQAQDTFSIVAVDTVTGEVGSAGASCLDMYTIPGYTNDFLGELFPGVGAINTQASYDPNNQATARARMNAGDSPSQIISWLIANDGDPTIRQYGIVRLIAGIPVTAGYTGTGTLDYKNHIAGKNYCIQGNILLGQKVLDSMEVRFKREKGDLACKLMAALQGAKMVGADSRCAANGTSSLFAFLKVSKPSDTFGNPYFTISVRTHGNAKAEPVDSLQGVFDRTHYLCKLTDVNEHNQSQENISVYPNPAINTFVIKITGNTSTEMFYTIKDILGRKISKGYVTAEKSIDISKWEKGIYFIEVSDGSLINTKKILKQ